MHIGVSAAHCMIICLIEDQVYHEEAQDIIFDINENDHVEQTHYAYF